MKRASSGGGRGRRAFGNEKGMKGTKGGHDWLKGVEDAWGWRGRAVETVARGTSDAHFCDFFGGRKEGEILWGNCKCFFFLFNFENRFELQIVLINNIDLYIYIYYIY